MPSVRGTSRKKLPEKQVRLIVKALADPGRYEILKKLRCQEGALACCQILADAKVTPATLSHHMKELVTADLVEPVRQGKFVSYTLKRDVLDAFLERVRTDLL